ncbi:LPXTG cell wall anchor domain-containing protein [Streptomyces camponoticapitis]|uniref:LPXTG cell wall anchor domain-containing protein n=2 Tax=Streptomyces camponoticapitis TaxID=1616125 RepID=A0ABQ2ECC0_9ACTN|nr:SCO1860 family LAETG-anchored protein [Streptomyces camponoticapitis]GGK02834.1 LPXTG cell wall anchor domain-containing protein [Streptomyces camponoticapitis]
MPARRSAALAAAAALVAAPVVLAAPAQATGGTGATSGKGKAGAVVLRTALDVSLLNKSVEVPLRASLNEVRAPADADRTALTVELDGVDKGRPFTLLRADAATARATADDRKAEGYADIARAKVHVPGLPLLSLIEVQEVTSKAVCEVGKKPVAESNLLGSVTVLGKKVTLTAGGPTRVEVPGVGEVTLDLSKTRTTSRTAAATALGLRVAVNPLKLNVADVQGTLTLAEATCEAPAEPVEQERPEPEKEGVEPQTASEPAPENLAETGGSSTTPYLVGGAVLLLAVGGGAMLLVRGRDRS